MESSEVLSAIAREDPVHLAALCQLEFGAAARAWLETRRPYISPRTQRDYDQYIRILEPFFGEMRLPEITTDLLRAYQRMRQARGAGPVTHETSALQQMLKRIGRGCSRIPKSARRRRNRSPATFRRP
jgi:hypothetical protein